LFWFGGLGFFFEYWLVFGLAGRGGAQQGATSSRRWPLTAQLSDKKAMLLFAEIRDRLLPPQAQMITAPKPGAGGLAVAMSADGMPPFRPAHRLVRAALEQPLRMPRSPSFARLWYSAMSSLYVLPRTCILWPRCCSSTEVIGSSSPRLAERDHRAVFADRLEQAMTRRCRRRQADVDARPPVMSSVRWDESSRLLDDHIAIPAPWPVRPWRRSLTLPSPCAWALPSRQDRPIRRPRHSCRRVARLIGYPPPPHTHWLIISCTLIAR